MGKKVVDLSIVNGKKATFATLTSRLNEKSSDIDVTETLLIGLKLFQGKKLTPYQYFSLIKKASKLDLGLWGQSTVLFCLSRLGVENKKLCKEIYDLVKTMEKTTPYEKIKDKAREYSKFLECFIPDDRILNKGTKIARHNMKAACPPPARKNSREAKVG